MYFTVTILLVASQSTNSQIIVETNNGFISGNLKQTEKPTNYYRFLGIPFAEPPIGNLRFENPVPKSNWTTTIDGSNYRSECIQFLSAPLQGSEDCLVLNIFTPAKLHLLNEPKLPVIIWIHGGAFIQGSANLTETGPDYFLDENIVFVSIQYRLGILGFLSTGDQVMPGNAGLKDQILAIKWINKNIGYFGGDANNVTLFGQSAGSVSISYLVQSQKITELYNRAIMDSGVSFCMWGLARYAPEFARSLVESDSSEDLVAKLKSLSIEELQAEAEAAYVTNILVKNPLNGFPIAPVIEVPNDNAVVLTKTHESLSKGHFDHVPILLGHNSLEIPFPLNFYISAYVSKYDKSPELLAPIDMNIDDDQVRSTVGESIKEEYFGNQRIAYANHNLSKFISDDEFVRPVQEYVKLFSNYASTFYYQFTYEGGLWGIEDRQQPGTSHTEELGYLFKTQYVGSEQDNLVRKRMVNLWSNFAKYGNPTGTTQPNLLWPIANANTNKGVVNLNIGADFSISYNLQSDKMEFWNNLYSTYGVAPTDTY